MKAEAQGSRKLLKLQATLGHQSEMKDRREASPLLDLPPTERLLVSRMHFISAHPIPVSLITPSHPVPVSLLLVEMSDSL